MIRAAVADAQAEGGDLGFADIDTGRAVAALGIPGEAVQSYGKAALVGEDGGRTWLESRVSASFPPGTTFETVAKFCAARMGVGAVLIVELGGEGYGATDVGTKWVCVHNVVGRGPDPIAAIEAAIRAEQDEARATLATLIQRPQMFSARMDRLYVSTDSKQNAQIVLQVATRVGSGMQAHQQFNAPPQRHQGLQR
jgi:hypothetical protein